MKYTCVESLIEIEIKNLSIRIWINRMTDALLDYTSENYDIAAKVGRLVERRLHPKDIIGVISEWENVNAVQVSQSITPNVRSGLVAYTVPFDPKTDPHG